MKDINENSIKIKDLSHRIKNIELFLFSALSLAVFTNFGLILLKNSNKYQGFNLYSIGVLVFLLAFLIGMFYILFLWYLYKVTSSGMNQLGIWLIDNWPIIKRIVTPVISFFKWLIIVVLILSTPYIYYEIYLVGKQFFWPALASGVLLILGYLFRKRKKVSSKRR